MNTNKLYIHLPIAILVFEWCAVFFLHYKNPYNYLLMSIDTRNIILTGLLFIALGYYFINSFYLDSGNISYENYDKLTINSELLGKIILIISFVILIGFALILKEIAKITSNFTLYLQNPFIVREILSSINDQQAGNVSIVGYKLGSYICSVIYPLSAIGGIMVVQKSKWRVTGVIPLLFVVFHSLIYLNRFGLISSVGIWFISMLYYSQYLDKSRRKQILIKIGISSIVAITFIVLFFVLILKIRAFNITNTDYLIKKSFYSYIASPGSAFEKFNFEHHKMSLGISSFRSVIKWFSRFGLIGSEMVKETHSAFTNVSFGKPMWLNTYTFAKAPYEDFGIVGVGVIGMIWGMVTRYAIQKSFRRFSFVNIFIVSILMISLIMTFYEFYFEGFSVIVYWIVIMVLFEKYLSKRIINHE